MIIFRYLAKELFSYMLAITLVLMTILLTNELAHYLKFLGEGLLTLTDVMKIMSTQVPLLLGYLLPMSFFLAVLLGLGRLYMEYEMTVLFSCGLSRLKLFGMVFSIALFVAAIVACLLLWIEPFMEQLEYSVLNHGFSNASIAKIMPRDFKRIGNNIFYASKRSIEKKSVSDVLFITTHPINYSNQNQKSNAPPSYDIVYAAHAVQQKLPKNPNKFLIFQNGYRYVGQPGKSNYTVMKFNHYGIDFALPKQRKHGWPLTASTSSLWQLGDSNLKAMGMLQWRYAMPISVIILALIAFPLSKTNPRQGKFRQIIPAILIFTVYYDLIYLGRHWIDSGDMPVWLGLWWLHASMLLFALIVMSRYFSWHWFRRMAGRSN